MLNYIIKGNQGDMVVSPYHFSDDFSQKEKVSQDQDFDRKASDVFEEALAQAQQVLDDAKKEAGQIRQEAYEQGKSQGWADGHEAGRQQAYEEYRQKLDQEIGQFQQEAAQAIQEITAKKELVLEKHIDDLKKTTMAIAEKIICTSLKSSGEIIKRMILSAAEKLKRTRWAVIYVAKTDHTVLLQADEDFLRGLSHLSDNIKVITREIGDPGTCVIEMPEVIVDASVCTQMENIRDILSNARLEGE